MMEYLNTNLFPGKAHECCCSVEDKTMQHFSVSPVPFCEFLGFGRTSQSPSYLCPFQSNLPLDDGIDYQAQKLLLFFSSFYLAAAFSLCRAQASSVLMAFRLLFHSFLKIYILSYIPSYRRALSYLPEFTVSHKYLKDCPKYPVCSKFSPRLTMENYSSDISDATSCVAVHFGKNTVLLW